MNVVPVEASVASEIPLQGHTLIVPGSGGLAHLGELCLDALITTLSLQRVAVVLSNNVLPVAMSSAFVEPGATGEGKAITTAAELYQGAFAPGITILQLRSAPVAGRRRALAEEILTWARGAGVAQVLVLASCSSHVKTDADLGVATQLRYVALGAAVEPGGEALEELLPLGFGLPEEVLGGQPGTEAAATQLLRGSGLASALLSLAASQEDGGSPTGGGPASFDPPARRRTPGVLCLLGLTSEALDPSLPELLVKAAFRQLAGRLPGGKAAPLQSPPSWRLHQVLPAPDRRLWA